MYYYISELKSPIYIEGKKEEIILVVHLWRKQSIKEEGSKNVKKPNRFRGVSGEI